MNLHPSKQSRWLVFLVLGLVLPSLLIGFPLGSSNAGNASPQEATAAQVSGTPVGTKTPGQPELPRFPVPTTMPARSDPLFAPRVPGEILVIYSPNATKADREAILQLQDLRDIEVVREIPQLRIAVVSALEASLPVKLRTLRQSPFVLSAEPNYLASAQETIPNDPGFAQQWGLRAIDAPAGWDIETGTSDAIIAVVDTGVDLQHPDLTGKIVPGWDFVNGDDTPQDDNGHGTHVAGIAAASTNNGIGVAGVAWGVRIMPVKVLDASGSGGYADVAEGIVYAVDHGAKVINLSLGGTAPSVALEEAVNYAHDRGAVVVAAAGNRGSAGVIYPARYPNVIAVAAVDAGLNVASFSSYGPEVDIAAPGVGIYSTFLAGGYKAMDGTSMAAPFVAGVAALLESRERFDTPEQVRAAIEYTGLDLGNAGRDEHYGNGLLSVAKTLSFNGDLTPVPTVSPGPTDLSTRLPNPTSGPVVTATPVPGWQVYTDDRMGLSVQFPPTWQVYITTETGRYPGLGPINLTSSATVSSAADPAVPPGEAVVVIGFQGNDFIPGQSLDEYVQKNLVSAYTRLSGNHLQFGARSAVEMVGELGRALIFSHGPNVYSVFLNGANDVIWTAEVDQIVRSIKFALESPVVVPTDFVPLPGSSSSGETVVDQLGPTGVSWGGPSMLMPWASGKEYKYNSGPHSSPASWDCVIVDMANMSGIDFGFPDKTEVLAVAAGRISNWGHEDVFGYGQYVIVDHGGGWTSNYWHLSKPDPALAVGLLVEQGTVIGLSGPYCGNPCNYHLHLDLRYNGQRTSWTGVDIDGWTVRPYRIKDTNTAFNYQGTLTHWLDAVSEITNYCGAYTVERWSTYMTLPPTDSRTIEAGDGQTVGSTNSRRTIPYGSAGGYVKDVNGNRVPGATVTFSGSGATRTTTTDSSGHYWFDYLPPGASTFSASASNYGSGASSATVIAWASVQVPDIRLNPVCLAGIGVAGCDPSVPTPTPPPYVPPGVVDGFRLISISSPTVLKGQTFGVNVTYEIVSGSLLQSRGDHLHATPEDNSNAFGAWPVQGVTGSHYAGERYTFSFNLTAPQQTGSFESKWRLRIGGNHIGPEAVVRFTVQDQPPAPPGGVIVCTGTGYSDCYGPLTQDYSSIDPINDQIESVWINGCYSAVLYWDSNFSGEHMHTGGTSDLGSHWRNQVSSIRVRSCDNAAFTIYGLGDYNGEAWASDRTLYDLGHWDKNDWAQSIRIASGKGIVACEHADFHGRCGRATGPAQFSDINALAQGLRNGLSSVRVCDGACPQPPGSPAIIYPVSGGHAPSNKDVILQWTGDGWQYYVELWGGGISGTRQFGWSSDSQWNVGQLPVSANPYYWHARGWNGYGEGGWSDGTFYVQPPTVEVMGVYTTDENGPSTQAAREPRMRSDEVEIGAFKTFFNAGDPIQLYLDTNNDFTVNTEAIFEWRVTDPAGRLVTSLSWSGTLSTYPGRIGWYMSGTIPSDALTGDYTFSGLISYSGQTTSQSTSFHVTGPPTVQSVGVFTTDELGPAVADHRPARVDPTPIQGSVYKTSFNAGDPIRLCIDVYSNLTQDVLAGFQWRVTDPFAREVQELSWTGDLTTSPGRTWWCLSSTIPTDAMTGDYLFHGSITYSGFTTWYESTFHVSGPPTLEAMEVFTTDESGPGTASRNGPQRKPDGVRSNAYKTSFNAGDPIQLWLLTYSDFPDSQDADYEWLVIDPLGREVPALEWSGTLPAAVGIDWWYLPSAIPANARTGEYLFVGLVTHNGRTTSATATFQVTGPPTVDVLGVFATDENGFSGSAAVSPQAVGREARMSTVKNSFDAGEPIRLYIETYNNIPADVAAVFTWSVTDPFGQSVPELSWSGTLTTPSQGVWWFLSSAIPAEAITGDYAFRGTITYNGQVSYQSTQFYVAGAIPPPYTLTRTVAASDPPLVVFQYARVALDLSNCPGGTVTVTMFSTAYPDPPAGVNFLPRYWDIAADFATGFTGTITFSYSEHDLTGLSENDIVGVARWNAANARWEYYVGTVDTTANTVTVSGVTQFGEWTLLASTPPKTPNLTGVRSGNDVRLTWVAVTQDIRGNAISAPQYHVYRRANNPYFMPAAGDWLATTGDTSYPDTGALAGGVPDYFYVVTAVDGSGAESALSTRIGVVGFALQPGAGP